MNKAIRIAFVCMTSCSLSQAARAADSVKLSLIAAPSYSSGDYGVSGQIVTMINAPLTVKARSGAFTVKATMSYVSFTTTTTSSGTGGPGPGGGGRSNATSTGGIADTWVTARYNAYYGKGAIPDVTPYVKTKLNTAATGLSSGQSAYEGGASLEWAVGKQWYPFIDAGWRNATNSAGTSRMINLYNAGVSYDISRKNMATVLYSGRRTQNAVVTDPSDIVFSWSHTYDPKTGIQAYFDKGLSIGSPNFEIGVGFERKI